MNSERFSLLFGGPEQKNLFFHALVPKVAELPWVSLNVKSWLVAPFVWRDLARVMERVRRGSESEGLNLQYGRA